MIPLRYDQYFLVDEKFADKEVGLLGLKPSDLVLEVGPGKGVLTRKLADKAKVIAIEKDRSLAPWLIFDSVEVIYADALKLDFSAIGFNKFASNIPYSISKDLTTKLLRTDFELGVIICQEEFARKLTARPGPDYRAVSVIAQYYASPSLQDFVPRSAFRPVPEVDSRIVLFKKERPADLGFEEFVKFAFSRRRKVLWDGKRPDQMSVEEFVKAFEEMERE